MGAHVLVVEDNKANLELLIFLLRAFGHAPTGAAEGREALDLARRSPPDMILCDLQLPAMDGFELVRALRSEPRLRGVPLIAVTAFAMPGDREKAIAAGCDAYIAKPIDPETFVPQLDSFLAPEKRSAARAVLPRNTSRDAEGIGTSIANNRPHSPAVPPTLAGAPKVDADHGHNSYR